MEKEKFKIRLSKDKLISVKGKKYVISLPNGEKVEVFTHRQRARKIDGKLTGSYWCVTDLESGLQIVGKYEYVSLMSELYKNTEESAITCAITKMRINVTESKLTFSELREKAMKRIQERETEKNGRNLYE